MRAANISKTIDDVLLAVLKTITIVLFMFLTFILTANVFVRFVPIASLHWLDEIVEMSFAGLVFYGAAAVWILKGHFSAGNWIEKRLKSARTRGLMHLLIDLLSLAFIAVFLFYSGDLVLQSMELSSVFLIPKKIFYLCMPISALIMTTYSVKYVVLDVIEIVKPEKT